jgi:hypothetical protein
VKNTELLSMSPTSASRCLGELDRQRLHVLKNALRESPCPHCLAPLTQVAVFAGGVVDDFTFGLRPGGDDGACPACGAGLRLVVPLMGPWFWTLRREWVAMNLSLDVQARAEALTVSRKGIPFASARDASVWLYRLRADQVEPSIRQGLLPSANYVWRRFKGPDRLDVGSEFLPLPDDRMEDWVAFATPQG